MRKTSDMIDPLGNYPKLPPKPPRELTDEELFARLPPRRPRERPFPRND